MRCEVLIGRDDLVFVDPVAWIEKIELESLFLQIVFGQALSEDNNRDFHLPFLELKRRCEITEIRVSDTPALSLVDEFLGSGPLPKRHLYRVGNPDLDQKTQDSL